MVPLAALWLPILLSAVLVFVASSVIHMLLGYHANDFRKLPREDEVLRALRPLDIQPGDYALPHAASMKEMQTPDYIEKRSHGPVAFMTVVRPGEVSMTRNFLGWFLLSIVISLLAGYIASRALGPGAEYKQVFRFVGTAAFMGYALGIWQNSIWYGRDVRSTLKSSFDGAIYALLTAGVFGWLWP
jgi:hypothetical protein